MAKRKKKKRKLAQSTRDKSSKKEKRLGGSVKKSEIESFKSQKELHLPKAQYWIILLITIVLAMGLRFVTFHQIFIDGRIYLQGADAYAFMREAENIQNGGFPETDPLLCYPEGKSTDKTLFPYFLAVVGKFIPLEWAAAFSSPLFALFSFIAVFLLLKELFPKNDYAVLGGTALASMTGIQLYSRSYFGMGDYHVLETFFSFFGLFAMIRGWRLNSFLWSAIAGISFLLYMMVWYPGSIFLGILAIGIAVKYVLSEDLPAKFYYHVGIIYLVPLVSSLFVFNRYVLIIGIGMLVLIPVLEFLRKEFSEKFLRLGIIACAFILLTIFLRLVLPDYFSSALKNLDVLFFGGNLAQNVKEMESMSGIYGTAMKAGFLPHLWIQLYAIFSSILGLFFAWKKKYYSIVIIGFFWFLMAFLHIRFEYYTVLFIAIGTAFLIERWSWLLWASGGFGVIFVLSMGNSQAQQPPQFPPSQYKMAEWINENLPEPGIANSGSYSDGEGASYGITSNWEYGYIFTYLGKRAFQTNPSHCNYVLASEILAYDNEDDAVAFMKKYNLKYIVVDTPTFERFYYHETQAGHKPKSTVSVNTDQGKATAVNEEYYYSMFSRLYNFDGKAVTAQQSIVIRNGTPLIFKTSQQAKDDVAKNGGEIYGLSYLVSPVDLPELKHFKLVHTQGQWAGGSKIFEFVE